MDVQPSNPQAASPSEDTPQADLGRFGMILFLAALAMLFAGGMLAYIAVRTQFMNPARQADPPLGALSMPMGLWASTIIIVFSSITLHWALNSIRQGRAKAAANAMLATSGLSLAFLAVQAPCLWTLASEHRTWADNNVFLYGLMALMIVVHAAHVIGGMLPMFVITRRAVQRTYTAKEHAPIKYMTMYWHFIDVIWLIMFAVFGLLG